MSDNPSDVAGSSFTNWLRALEEARERVLISHVRYPYARGFRLEALPDDDEEEETPKQRKAREKAEQAKQEQERKQELADAIAAAIKAVDETHAKVVPESTRPDFDSSQFDSEPGSPLPQNLKSVTVSNPDWKKSDGTSVAGKIVPFPLTPGGWRGVRGETGEPLGTLVDKAIDKAINLNRFPKDFDANDFSMARYCMAVEHARNTHLQGLAFQKIAPKEYQFYQALEYYSKESKALGEMVSGQDGGFLAPEIFSW